MAFQQAARLAQYVDRHSDTPELLKRDPDAQLMWYFLDLEALMSELSSWS